MATAFPIAPPRGVSLAPARSATRRRPPRSLLLALGCLPAAIVLFSLHAAALAGPAGSQPPTAAGSWAGGPPAVQGLLLPTASPSTPLSSAEVIAQVRRSVARLTVVSQYGTVTVMGSGFYIGDRLVVTAAHLLAGAQSISAEIDLGAVTTPATFVGWDTAKDIALVRLNLEREPDVPALALRPTERRAAGLMVLALGYPSWSTVPEPSASAGIVSRYLQWGTLGWVLEADARGDLGNDGGPIVDATGAVVGMSQGWVASPTWPAQLAVTSDQIAASLPSLKGYGGWGQESRAPFSP